MIGIRDVASYLPERRLHSGELQERLGFKPGFLENKVGIETRRLAAPDESTSDMCVRAFEALRGRYASETFADVGLLLLCTQNPDFKLPHTSSILQNRLGLPQRLLAFDISLGCSGYVSSLVTAKALMTEMGIRQALVFTCDPYSKIIDPNDKSTVSLFSDAASVSLVEIGAPLEIGKSVFGNDGSLFEALIVRGSGTARRNGEPEQALRMDGRTIFTLLKTQIPQHVRACAAANGLALEDVDLFLLHQASAWLLEGLRADLGVSSEKVPSNIRDIGNTVSTSIPLLLEDVLQSRRPLPRTMLLSGFGVGLSWASVVLRARG
jgi:3-oxoacyl-[acyl-carrier-protein] synthase-3